ncbi:MAG: hypothetical protein ABFD92_02870 [Planctomycetaceae bacterium]|nr:hypothetical protein [Planctomycetaceae bacterium]
MAQEDPDLLPDPDAVTPGKAILSYVGALLWLVALVLLVMYYPVLGCILAGLTVVYFLALKPRKPSQ